VLAPSASKTAQIYNILHSLGLSYQKGMGYFPQADERAEMLETIKKLQSTDEASVVVFEDGASLLVLRT
jgi:hypothetical protein